MKDRICLITGATSGIGEVTARELAKKGAQVILLGRNRKKTEQTRQHILEVCGHDKVYTLIADLSSMKQVRKVAVAFNSRYPRLDVLINNAGLVMGNQRELTDEGIETTFAINHLAPFLLTFLLFDKLTKSKQARIINVSSMAHRMASLDLNDLQLEKKYSGYRAYNNSKLCSILFTRELAKRLKNHPNITANSLHPGVIKSNFSKNAGSGLMYWMFKLFHSFMITPEKGAETTIYLASADEAVKYNGQFFTKKKTVTPSKKALDNKIAQQLWETSERMTGVKFLDPVSPSPVV